MNAAEVYARRRLVLAEAGDAEAAFEMAMWRFTGADIRRDLSEARRLVLIAANAGHADADRVATAFLANATGGDRNWLAAIARLEHRSIGDRQAAQELEIIQAMNLDTDGRPKHRRDGTPVSEDPEIIMFSGFLSAAECDWLCAAAASAFRPALTVDPTTGKQIANPIRTSETAAFPLSDEPPAMHAINRRIASASGTEVGQGEPLQILRYSPGQEYRSHSDALPSSIPNQRTLTFLAWLNEGYEGGETVFPAIHQSFRGRRGDALLFRNVTADGRPDGRAVHLGQPVVKGTKLLASRWIRARPLDLTGPPGRPL